MTQEPLEVIERLLSEMKTTIRAILQDKRMAVMKEVVPQKTRVGAFCSNHHSSYECSMV